MKKVLETIKDNKIAHYFIILVISLLISIPFLKISLIGKGHDFVLHLLRIIGLNNAILYSKFPYIISPFYCNNFGYATNLFYPGLTTYCSLGLKFFTNSYETALELFAFLTVFFSGIFMYRFTQQITRNKIIALISSIIYITFPYRMENIYERFAIGEFTALIFLPILFQGLYNLIKQDKSKHYLITIGAVGLLLSHTVTTVYAAIFSFIFILYNMKDFLRKDVISLCMINILFILTITSLFTVPLFEHKFATNYTIFNAEAMRGTGKDVQNNSVTLKQLITDSGSEQQVSFMIGIPIILYMFIGMLAYENLLRDEKEYYITFFIMGMISLFMVTKLFPWKVMPTFMTMIQFPWRMLAFFNLFISPVCAINIYTILKHQKNRKIAVTIGTIFLLIFVSFTAKKLNEFVIEKTGVSQGYEDYEEKILANPQISCMMINREYLPAKSEKQHYSYIRNREDRVYLLNGECIISNQKKQGLEMNFEIENLKENTVLELPYLYYLGYNIQIHEGKATNSIPYEESEHGLIQLSFSKNIEKATISVEYTGTVIEKISYLISGVGFIFFVIYIIIYQNKRGENEKRQNH